jgi:hypothetical protein
MIVQLDFTSAAGDGRIAWSRFRYGVVTSPQQRCYGVDTSCDAPGFAIGRYFGIGEKSLTPSMVLTYSPASSLWI